MTRFARPARHAFDSTRADGVFVDAFDLTAHGERLAVGGTFDFHDSIYRQRSCLRLKKLLQPRFRILVTFVQQRRVEPVPSNTRTRSRHVTMSESR